MAHIELIDVIVPKNNGTFPTHDSTYGKGGWHEVSTQADRDAIPAARRRAGMAVNVITDNKVYTLGTDLSTWAEFSGGSGGGIPEAPLDGAAYVRNMGAWVNLQNYLDGGIVT